MLSMYRAMRDEPVDKALFEDAYNRYNRRMIAIAYNIIGNYHDAEEAVSNAFFKIAANFDKVRKRTGQERAAYYCIVNCSTRYNG